MPRLRPMKTAKEIAAVPEDQPVMIELPADGTLEIESGKESQIEKDEPEKEVEVQEPEEVVEVEEEPEEVDEQAALREQLARLTKAEEDGRKREQALIAEREEARKEAQERTTEALQSRQQTTQAQYDAVMNALEANKEAADAAQRDYETATINQEPKLAAEAMRRIQRAEAQIVRLEEGRDALEARLKEPVKEAPKPVDRFEQAIANLPNEAKTWLRAHPDYMTDQRKNAKIQALHWDALDAGHASFSTPYFEFVEEKLGLRQPKDAPKVAAEERVRAPVVAAPVARESISVTTGKTQTTRVTLTPKQREAAANSNISEMEYARQLLKLEQAKKEGHYSESR